MTKTLSAYDVRTNFGAILSQVYYGNEEIIVTKTGKPMVKIIKADSGISKKNAQYYLSEFKALRKLGKQIDAVESLRKERDRETASNRP